jgi:DNA-binding CsgD family transcriptional regulator
VTHSIAGTAASQSIPLSVFTEWIDGADGQLRSLAGAAISALTETSQGKPVLIVVDDAQLLDDLSAFVIHQIVRRRAAHVILTARTGGADDSMNQFSSLWKDGLLLRLDLQPLSQDQCGALLQAVLGGQVGAQTVQRMWNLTRGNVLFLYQLVREELQEGRLHTNGATWRWTGEMTASPTLVELVDLYVGTAPEEILDVLDLIAVAEPLELAYLATLADSAEIEEAEQHGFIIVEANSGNPVIRFSHPLYGEIRRERLGPLRAARLRGAVARAIKIESQAEGRSTDWLRLALLWLESDLPPDAGVLLAGAIQAFQRLDLDLTNRLCTSALAAGAGPEARLIYALSQYSMGLGIEAEATLDELPPGLGSDFLWLVSAMIKIANRQFLLARPEESWTVLEEALAAAPPSMADQLLPLRVAGLAMAARPAEAVTATASIATEALSALPASILACGEVIALGDLGLPHKATIAAETSRRLAANAPEATYQMVALHLLHAEALTMGGLIDQVQSLGEQLHAQWADIPADPAGIALAVNGVAALARGDLTSAQQQLRAAIAECQPRHGKTGVLYLFWLAYTEALARAGKAGAASEALQKAEQHRHPSYVFVEPNRLVATGWVAASRGQISEAIALAGRAADFACAHGQFAREVMALQSALQFGDHSRAERIVELTSLVEGPRAPLAARWATALAHGDGNALLCVSEDLERMGDWIAAADAAAHAAQKFNRSDTHRSRQIASGRASHIIARCGGATPATSTAAAPQPLSPRERQIAALAGQGLSNKQIADTLCMSFRTVEGHIYRACTKLGLNTRSELAHALEQGSVSGQV